MAYANHNMYFLGTFSVYVFLQFLVSNTVISMHCSSVLHQNMNQISPNRRKIGHRNIQAEHEILRFKSFLIPHAKSFLWITQLKLTVFNFKLSGTEQSLTKSFMKNSHTLGGKNRSNKEGSHVTSTVFYTTVWSIYFYSNSANTLTH